MRKKQIVATLIILAILIPTPAAAAASQRELLPSIAIITSQDRENSAGISAAASGIGEAMKFAGGFRVVESKLATDIVHQERSLTERDPALIRAEEKVAHAKEHFFKFNNEQADREITAALEELKGLEQRLPDTGAVLADAYVSKAVFEKSRGNMAAAKRSLHEALLRNPHLNLALESYPPGLVAACDEERRALQDSPSGIIEVRAKPGGAEVFLNGVAQGQSPLAIRNLPVGSYWVSVSGSGFASVSRRMEVVAGKSSFFHERLGRKPGESGRRAAGSPAESPAESDEALINESIRMGEAMGVDKVLLIRSATKNGASAIEARLIDQRLKLSQPPLIAKMERDGKVSSKALADLTLKLSQLVLSDIASNPAKLADPLGTSDPSLLARRKRELHKNPLFWGILGLVAAGALGGGLAAAMSGGGSSGADMGAIHVSFK